MDTARQAPGETQAENRPYSLRTSRCPAAGEKFKKIFARPAPARAGTILRWKSWSPLSLCRRRGSGGTGILGGRKCASKVAGG